MAVYRETDGDIVREYALQQGKDSVQLQGDFAFIELIPTKAFGWSLFLDNELQFAETDEYIYHEALVHPCLAFSNEKNTVCILGGGDGCAAREVLKWTTVDHIDLYDWDSELVDYFRSKDEGKRWNRGSLSDPKLFYQATDIATIFSNSETERYDVIVVDLLDPEFKELEIVNGFWANLLQLIRRWKKQGGSIVINAGGVTPWQTDCFSMLLKLCKTFFATSLCIPYKVFVPSFGREWAYILIVDNDRQSNEFPRLLRRVNETTVSQSFVWEPDFKIDRDLLE